MERHGWDRQLHNSGRAKRRRMRNREKIESRVAGRAQAADRRGGKSEPRFFRYRTTCKSLFVFRRQARIYLQSVVTGFADDDKEEG